MLLLITYVSVALGFSFLCSLAEAVILSVTTAHIALLEQQGKPSGSLLRKLNEDINAPLAAILTLNTIAHTVGAVGAGAQATTLFGNAYVGIASAILTLLILVFSEIIPKTLGAHYWRTLAPPTAHGLRVLIWVLYPFIILSERLTRGLTGGPRLTGFSRDEFAAMAERSVEEGELEQQESRILINLLALREMRVKDAMTPRTVVVSLPEELSVQEFIEQHDNVRFSRIPIYGDSLEHINGFVLRADLLYAQVAGDGDRKLKNFRRDLYAVPASLSLSQAFDELLIKKAHILLVINEYGGMDGIITLEDVIETLLGLEIIDESDKTEDMQKLAKRLWKRRAQQMGVNIEEIKGERDD